MDTLLNKTVQNFLLQDTVYVTKIETVNIARPESVKTKLKEDIKKDSVSVKKISPISNSPKISPDGSFFKQLKVVGQITFWTVLEIIFIVVFGYLLLRLLDSLRNSPLAKERLPLLQSILIAARAFVWFFIIYLILSILLGDTKEITLVIIIVAIIIIGVSLLPLLKNFIGGIFISIMRPFEKGNFIRILDHYGEVQSIGWRSTKILSGENSVIYIPNSLFLTNIVENINVGKREQLMSLEFEFPSSNDSQIIVSLLRDAAISSPYTFSKKEVKVYLSKADFTQNINKYEVNLYLFDSRFENELIDSINNYLLKELNNKPEKHD